MQRRPGFEDPDLREELDALELSELDDLEFGLIVLDDDQRAVWYNAVEAASTGFAVADVLGKLFFEAVGPCMNNYLVADRFRSEDELDDQLDYVFTVNLAPTPVRLRLLKRPTSSRQYLAVRFR